jgi:hypothetical protein
MREWILFCVFIASIFFCIRVLYEMNKKELNWKTGIIDACFFVWFLFLGIISLILI